MAADSEFLILHSQDFKDEYNKYLSDPRYRPLREYFNHRRFFIKDTNQTYRVISHWCSLQLLNDCRDKAGSSWKQFTVTELVWINILMELRSIGFSLEKLQHAYKTMFKTGTAEENSILEFCIFQALAGSQAYLIILPESGAMNVIIDDDLLPNILNGNLLKHHYVQLNLYKCMQNVDPEDDYFTDLLAIHNTPNINVEQKIIDMVRSQQHDEIKVVMKDGKVHRITKTNKKMGNVNDFSKLLRNIEFGDFHIKIEDGVVVCTETTEVDKV